MEEVDAEINLVGSLRTGLLMKHRDIDFHIYSSPLNLADSFLAMARLAENPSIKRIIRIGETAFKAPYRKENSKSSTGK